MLNRADKHMGARKRLVCSLSTTAVKGTKQEVAQTVFSFDLLLVRWDEI